MILQLKNKHMMGAIVCCLCDDVQHLDTFTQTVLDTSMRDLEKMLVTYGGTPCPACDDVDEDGVCDDEDDCVGSYDDCGVCNGDNSSCTGCMDESACDYDASATIQAVEYSDSVSLSFSWVQGSWTGEVSWTINGGAYLFRLLQI